MFLRGLCFVCSPLTCVAVTAAPSSSMLASPYSQSRTSWFTVSKPLVGVTSLQPLCPHLVRRHVSPGFPYLLLRLSCILLTSHNLLDDPIFLASCRRCPRLGQIWDLASTSESQSRERHTGLLPALDDVEHVFRCVFTTVATPRSHFCPSLLPLLSNFIFKLIRGIDSSLSYSHLRCLVSGLCRF